MSLRGKTSLHPYLEEQLRALIGDGESLPEEVQELLSRVDDYVHKLEEKNQRLEAPLPEDEKALREKEELYRTLVEHSPDAIAIYQEGIVRYVNPAAVRMAGVSSAADLLGKSIFDFVHEDVRATIEEDIRKLKHDHRIPLHETKLKRANGEAVDVELTATPFTFEAKPATLAIWRDVTDYKSVHSMLSRIVTGISSHIGNEFYSHFVASLAKTLGVDIAYVAEMSNDVADEYQTCAFFADGQLRNNFHYRRSGTPCETVVGQQTRVFPQGVFKEFPNDRFISAERIEGYIGVPLFDRERRPLGLLAVMSRTPIRNPEILVSIMKIFAERASAEMERVRVLQRLMQNERHFRKLMDQAADGIVVAGPEGDLTYANERAVELLGFRRSEILGRKFRDFLPAEEVHLLATDMKHIRRGSVLNIQRTLVRKDGHEIKGDISAIVMDDGSIQVIIRDMTERYRVEEERKSYLETIAMLEEVAIELDRNFRIVRVSESWEKLFHDHSGDSPLGRAVENWFHPDYQYILK